MFKTVLVEDEKNNLDLLNHFIKNSVKTLTLLPRVLPMTKH